MTGLAVRLGHRTSTCSRQQAEKCFSELVLPHAYRPKPDLTKRVRSAVQVFPQALGGNLWLDSWIPAY